MIVTDIIKEIIIVEGRDDENAVKRAKNADIISTHGFGISKETWELIEKAYEDRGIIILTDPDFSGEVIRKKLNERFPNSKNAFMSREDATFSNDIGIENASPEAIITALRKAKYTVIEGNHEFTLEDMVRNGLSGEKDSSKKRAILGKSLGIGYGNTNTFLKKLNQFGVSREDFVKNLDGINK